MNARNALAGYVLLVAAWHDAVAQAPGATDARGPFALEACEVVNFTARCGTYWVFEDRARRTGRTIPVDPASNNRATCILRFARLHYMCSVIREVSPQPR